MEENYKVQEILKWYKQFNNTDIKISGESKSFDININNRSLPHLLGLHYINTKEHQIKGRGLYDYIIYNNLSDEEIYRRISSNNAFKINDVANRINTFKEFMENLENGYIYEQTNKYTNLKSSHLIVQTKDNKYLHLGIARENVGDFISDYIVDDSINAYLETYFERKDKEYFKDSKIFEKVKSIERYNDKGELEPFSFRQEKNLDLEILNDKTLNLNDMFGLIKDINHPKEKEGIEFLVEKARELGIESMYDGLSYNDKLALIEELESSDFNELMQAFEKKHLNVELDVRIEKKQQKHRYDRSL
ncbi:MAG: PBECR4 domain-containing protein [Erysipelotrichaceae bacterium]|nr:PBECR4 domain-containing protein [Erysipelotrichaceae bacterium]